MVHYVLNGSHLTDPPKCMAASFKQVKIDLKEMLRKRSVGVNNKTTFPAQALP